MRSAMLSLGKNISCRSIVIIITTLLCSVSLYAQFELLDKLEKPEGTEKRKLGAEKSPSKKFTRFREFTQNNFSYYNFYFNAKDRFDDLIKEARTIKLRKDLREFEVSFGEEDEAYMSSRSLVLDSIIVKCKAGILLHDLRTKWTDDLLLLMGKCYFYLGKYDTAFTFFQYINNAYKTDEGYDDQTIFIDNISNKYSIATSEEKARGGFLARNDALLWMTLSLAAKGEWNSALAIITLLETDLYFPKRLKPQLLQAKAFCLYKKGEWSDAASVLENTEESAGNKKKYSTYLTKKMILIASLYEKGYRYHDAYRVYQKTADRTKDKYSSMYANIKKIGLDFSYLIHKQVEEIINNKKYKKYKPYMYFEIAKKLYALKYRDPFDKIAHEALAFAKELKEEKVKALRLMIASNYIQSHQYLLAGEALSGLQKESITQEERERYDLRTIEATDDIYQSKLRVDKFDSLLRLGDLSSKQLEETIRKIKRSVKNTKEAQALKEPKKSSAKTSAWYFSNDYLLIKGKQEFEDKYGIIRNRDGWINAPVADIILPSAGDDHSLVGQKKETTDFISQIPTTGNKKNAIQDSLFYALSDLVIKTLNYFQDLRDALPYLQRTLDMKISAAANASEKMDKIKKIARLLKLSPTADSSNFLAEERERPSLPATSSLDNAKKSDAAYHLILIDFLNGDFAKFVNGQYNASNLSKVDLFKFKFLEASSFARMGDKEIAKQKFNLIATSENCPPKLKENAKLAIELLK